MLYSGILFIFELMHLFFLADAFVFLADAFVNAYVI